MTEVKELQRMTLEEFLREPQEDGWIYELIDGIKMMSPRPAGAHQMISGNLFSELRSILRGKGCGPLLEMDLVLKDNNLIPDLMVICDDVDISELKRYEKPPLIAIEIVSPSTASIDYFTKRLKYEHLGVKEYWIVSPDEKCIVIINFVTGQQERFCEGQVSSYALPEIQIDLNKIFDLSF